MIRRILVMVVLIALPAAAHAQDPSTDAAACTSGTFIVEGDALLPGAPANPPDAVILRSGMVAIASGCPPVAATIGQTPFGTTVRADWLECDGLAKRVRLRARIDPTCRKMLGIVAAHPLFRRRFAAAQCNDPVACSYRCVTNRDCRDAAYCAKEPGQCDGTGVCQPHPDVCPENADPVCGCDGRSYGNACEAAVAGVNVRHRGRCEVSCDPADERPCAAGQFCESRAGLCASTDLKGICIDVPTGCPDVLDPVCGCDGRTYANDCERRTAGVQKDHDGPCLDDVCELICATNAQCRPDAYCQKRVGRCDARGLCRPRPQVCTDEYAPVCGCDDRTYANRCDAAAAGVSVAHRGPCRQGCGTIAGLTCPDGQFCEFEPAMCDVADLGGFCLDVPQACPRIFEPVCGCDGVTYGNDCVRQRAQVALDHKGECLTDVNPVGQTNAAAYTLR